MGTSAYPGALDNFSESSPTYMADPDATGRTHAGRHDDVESAVEQVEETLGVNPQGGSATVAARIAGVENGVITGGQDLDAHAANLDAHIPAGAQALGSVGALQWDESVGRRCFAWDTVNNRWQMVYGDTGSRAVANSLINGWTAIVASSAWIRRIGNTVWFDAYLSASAASSVFCYQIPTGFRPAAIRTALTVWGSIATNSPVGGLARIDTDTMQIQLNDAVALNNLLVSMSWPAADPWPTSLPGIADGGIPTLLPIFPE